VWERRVGGAGGGGGEEGVAVAFLSVCLCPTGAWGVKNEGRTNSGGPRGLRWWGWTVGGRGGVLKDGRAVRLSLAVRGVGAVGGGAAWGR